MGDESIQSPLMLLLGRIAALEGEIGALRGAPAESGDACARSAGWIGSSAAMDYSDFAFGFSISAAIVTVKSGYIFHGIRPAITVAGAPITIAADNTYIYVSYAFGGGAASVTSRRVFPQHTATTLNWLLYKVTLTDGAASISAGNIHHLGSITIPGVFA